MKKLILPLSLAVALGAGAQTKFDAGLQSAISTYRDILAQPTAKIADLPDLPFSRTQVSRGAAEATVLISLAPGYTADDLADAGLDITVQSRDVVVATAPIETLLALEENDAVQFIELSMERQPQLDKARKAVGMDVIHEGGDGLPRAYTGKGVICGIFDTGVDPNHINFRTTDLSANRVERLWHFTGTSGGYRAYSTPDEIAGFTTDTESKDHGTHTTGCMAGANKSMTGTPGGLSGAFAYINDEGKLVRPGNKLPKADDEANPYYGMAPDGTIAIGCSSSLVDANILGAVRRIADYAKTENKPFVVNISIGTTIGSHDQYSSFNRQLDQIVEENGGIVILAAGNDGDGYLSLVKELTSSQTSFKTLLIDNQDTPGTFAGYIDIWASDDRALTVRPVVYNKSTGQIVSQTVPSLAQGTVTLATDDLTAASYKHDTSFSEACGAGSYLQMTATTAKYAQANYARFNNRITYTMSPNTSKNSDGHLVVGLLIEGAAGQRVDMVSFQSKGVGQFTNLGMSDWETADNNLSISSMACGKNIVSVGAWTTRNRWGTLATTAIYGYTGSGFTVGDICGFSSYGKLYDGVAQPAVCAPGAGIISSVSYYTNSANNSQRSASYTYNGRVNLWVNSQGTSMAAPIVAGSIATWLEANPSLNYADVLDIIKRTSDTDSYTAAAPERWGAGKFNALAGLKEAIRMGGVSDIAMDNNNLVISANGADGYDIFLPGVQKINATVYNMAGAPVATTTVSGDNATISTSALAKGVYILNVNGSHSRRILVK